MVMLTSCLDALLVTEYFWGGSAYLNLLPKNTSSWLANYSTIHSISWTRSTELELIPCLLYHHEYSMNHQVSLILFLKYLSTPGKCLFTPNVSALTKALGICHLVYYKGLWTWIPASRLSLNHPPHCCQSALPENRF